MADAVISYVIQKIGDAIINEALFLRSVKQQAEELKRELIWMESFLQDADAKARGGNKLVQNWVKEVREAAHDAEDLIESIAIQGSEPGIGQKRRGLFSNLLPGALIPRHNSGMEIEELKQRIIKIGESAARYGITALPDDRRERREVDAAISGWRARSVEASNSSHVFVRDADKKAILELLDKKREELSVVSIFGTGGLGKTTLVQKVCNDPQITDRIHNIFWIGVSQDCKIENLLKDLLRKISREESQENETMDMLESRLHDSLLGKTYLIVMDDVWDVAVWRIVGNCLPDEKNGSKVLITTRSSTVARAADPDQAYELQFLDKEESWELFISKAIPREEDRGECEGRLKELGEKMAEECGGLPLALVVMGSLLSQKGRSTEEWERVSHVWRDNDKEGSVVTRILAMSYADLPYDLKWCFLYLSAFPEDHLIESDRLIGLWIAEGFIAERGDGLTLEESAEIQLEKLIERSLVHVVEQDNLLGVIICRVHDLIRELCISEAQQIDFMSVCQRRSPLPAESLRRLSVITEPEETMSKFKSAPRLKALLSFNFHSELLDPHLAINLSDGGLKLIRVIYVHGKHNLEMLPKVIGGFVNLRYLSLQDRKINSLPETIKNLSRLQFLDIRLTLITEMTSAVWEIETLRQVFFPHAASAPNRVQCRWKSLQVLRWVCIGDPDWMDDTLPKVKDIKTLEIWQISDSHHEVLSLNLPEFSRLKFLKLQGPSIPWTALTLSGLRQLRTLVLDGPIKSTFPEEVRPEDIPGPLNYGWPASLTYLELFNSDLHWDPLPSLGQLSELKFLKLKGKVCSWVEEMKFHKDEFKQLQKLELRVIKELERIIVEDGAMPRLQKLKIAYCSSLQMIPVDWINSRSSIFTFVWE